MSTLSTLSSKVFLNLKLDLEWMVNSSVPFFQRAKFFGGKYGSILRNRRSVGFLGHEFHYDNRLAPALMPDYVKEISELDNSINLSSVSTVLDIGANVGQFSYTLLSMFPGKRVYSLEPNPEAFSILQKNSEQFLDWNCYQVGLSDERATLPFYYVPGKSGQGSLIKENAALGLLATQVAEIQIELAPLTIEKAGEVGIPTHFDLVKIDVEGAERQVLNGLSEINWNYLYVELSLGRDGALNADEATKILKKPKPSVECIFQGVPMGPAKTFQAIFRSSKD